MVIRPFWLVIVALFSLIPTTAAARDISVADTIGMTRLFRGVGAITGQPYEIARSPEGQYFAFIVRRGSLTDGKNQYSLMSVRASEVEEYMSGRGASRPTISTLATFETSAPAPAIEQAVWVNGDHAIAFIGRSDNADNNRTSLYLYDFRRHSVRRLLAAPHDIVSFAISRDAAHAVIQTRETLDWAQRNAHGWVVTGETLDHLLTRDPRDVQGSTTFLIGDLRSGKLRATGLVSATEGARQILFVGNDRAIVSVQLARFPTEWRQYAVVSGPYAQTVPDGPSEQRDLDYMGRATTFVFQAMQINIATSEVRPLVRAPLDTPDLAADAVAFDGRHTLFMATLAPLNLLRQDDPNERRILQIGLDSSEVRLLPKLPSSFSMRSLRATERGPVASGVDAGMATQLVYDAGSWRPLSDDAAPPLTASYHLRSIEAAGVPFEIAVEDSSGVRRVLTDFNSRIPTTPPNQLQQFAWTDRFNRHRTETLLLPSNYEPTRRYPAVIQTYGAAPNEYDLTNITTGMAAHALAARGIVVIQVGCEDADPSVIGAYGELPPISMCLDDLLQQLDLRGIVDLHRVGIVGFSRTGLSVSYALTNSSFEYAAALISDSVQATPWSYALNFGVHPGMTAFDDSASQASTGLPPLVGTQILGEGIRGWLNRSPAFAVDRIRAPLRFEYHGVDYPPAAWDTFVILKRASKPVEMVHIPNDGHNLETPFGRYTSQQGAVDWFDFWLNGRERSEPYADAPESRTSLAEQYQRWRELRTERDAASAQPRPPLRDWSWAPRPDAQPPNSSPTR